MAAMHGGASKKNIINTGHPNNAIPQDGEAPLQSADCVGFAIDAAPKDEKWLCRLAFSGLEHCSEHSSGVEHTWEILCGLASFPMCMWTAECTFSGCRGTTSIGSWSGFIQLLCRATLENNMQETPEHVHPLSTFLLIIHSLTYLRCVSRRLRRTPTTVLCSAEATMGEAAVAMLLLHDVGRFLTCHANPGTCPSPCAVSRR